MLTDIEKTNLDLVQRAMDGILVDHDEASVDQNFHRQFIQHNPFAKDGSAHVREMCAFTFGLEIKRWVAQGDLVGYHGYYTAPNPLGDLPLVCFDLWRVQGGQIVEHWDALAPVPQAHADIMTDGPGDGQADVNKIACAENTARARQLLEVGIGQNDPQVRKEFLAPTFTLHMPDIADGQAALTAWIEKERPTVTLQRTVASGDLVMAHLHLGAASGEKSVYDIFRFDADGRITNQWNVSQAIVPRSEAANPHPHF